MSVLWRFDRETPVTVPVLAALALRAALPAKQGLRIKWPNDILHDNAKLGGILVELQNEPDRALAVIGIGLNLTLPDSLVEQIKAYWAARVK